MLERETRATPESDVESAVANDAPARSIEPARRLGAGERTPASRSRPALVATVASSRPVPLQTGSNADRLEAAPSSRRELGRPPSEFFRSPPAVRLSSGLFARF